MNIVRYRIVGLRPLLMHNPAAMLTQRGDGINTKRIPTPEAEAEAGAYRLKSGQLYLPAIAFRGAIIGRGGGAANRRLGKKPVTQIVSSSMFLTSDQCPLFHPDTDEPLKDYEIYTCRAVVQRNAVMRSRPRLEAWACELAVELDTTLGLTAELLQELLNIGGKVAGVGDFRPQCKGMFGQFRAELID